MEASTYASKLSVTIITLNEEKDLPRCLNSLKGVVDEIVVVDSGSSDKTVDIVKKFGSKIFYRKFDNYAAQKNFAAEKAAGDWILSVDADEVIPPELAKEIKSQISQEHSSFNSYSIPRKNFILGEYIKHTRWQPELDRHIWLWRKGWGKWVGKVHEEIVAKGQVGRLKYAKVHYQYETINQFMCMINNYSNIDASERVKKGSKFSLLRLFFDPIYNFSVRYFYRAGFLDGWRGFILSYLMAVYHLVLLVKVWEEVDD